MARDSTAYSTTIVPTVFTPTNPTATASTNPATPATATATATATAPAPAPAIPHDIIDDSRVV